MSLKMTDQQHVVLEAIRAGEPQADIAERMGITVQRVSQVVRYLVEHGLLVEPRRAKFQATDEPHLYTRRSAKPVSAVRYTDEASADRIGEWVRLDKWAVQWLTDDRLVLVSDGYDGLTVNPGDWVVRTSAGRFQVRSHPRFFSMFEAVSE